MNTVLKPNRLRLFSLSFLSIRNRGLLSAAAVTAFVVLCIAGPVRGQDTAADPRDRKIQELEKTVGVLAERVDAMDKAKPSRGESWADRFTFGGYGEMHANFGSGSAPDQFDIHRLVAYVGYTCSDWIRFHSEVELEHAFVSSESGGELSVEQSYLDFLLSDPRNVRFGRVLVPSLKYELYLVNGLDGSQFSAVNGIRDGRIKERGEPPRARGDLSPTSGSTGRRGSATEPLPGFSVGTWKAGITSFRTPGKRGSSRSRTPSSLPGMTISTPSTGCRRVSRKIPRGTAGSGHSARASSSRRRLLRRGMSSSGTTLPGRICPPWSISASAGSFNGPTLCGRASGPRPSGSVR